LRARALQLDRARQRARAEWPRTAPACDAYPADPLGRQLAEGDITEERIGDRHTVEQHQRPAGRIAAQRTQRDTLRARIAGSAVGAAELLESGHRPQGFLDTARWDGQQLVARDGARGIGRDGGRIFQPLPGHDDHGSRVIAFRLALAHPPVLRGKRGDGAQKDEEADGGATHAASAIQIGCTEQRAGAATRNALDRSQHWEKPTWQAALLRPITTS